MLRELNSFIFPFEWLSVEAERERMQYISQNDLTDRDILSWQKCALYWIFTALLIKDYGYLGTVTLIITDRLLNKDFIFKILARIMMSISGI